MQPTLTGRRPALLGVVGNISRDTVTYPGERVTEQLGGAALHLALAASRAGLTAAPAAVIGPDLTWITSDPRLSLIDFSLLKTIQGTSCAFSMTYDDAGQVASTNSTFGVSAELTCRAVSVLASRPAWHVCCRRPLDAGLVLSRLATLGIPFSADFHLASAREILPQVRLSLPRAAAIFVNAAEFTTLEEAADIRGLPLAVVSDGPRPVVVLRHGAVTASATPPSVEAADVTGAGDTLAGTFLAGISHGVGDADALRAAVTAASEVVARPGLAIPLAGR